MYVAWALLCLYLTVFFLPLLPFPDRVHAFLKPPLSLRYALGGVLGLAAWATLRFGEYWWEHLDTWILLWMHTLSPLWFSTGIRRSLKDFKGHKAIALRWLNVAGFTVSVGLILMRLGTLLMYRGHSQFVPLLLPAIAALGFSIAVLSWPTTNFPWARLLPGYPAVILMPWILNLWAGLWFSQRESYSMESGWEWWAGFPFGFSGFWDTPENTYTFWHDFEVPRFLLDFVIGLSVAWLGAFGAEWLVVRRLRGGVRGLQEEQRKDSRHGAGAEGEIVGNREIRRLAIPPSLWYFIGGIAPLAVTTVNYNLDLLECHLLYYPCTSSVIVAVALFALSPIYFFVGARLAWREMKEGWLWARLSRWLNILALASSLGLFLFCALSALTGRLY